jgi:hypothetical protein
MQNYFKKNFTNRAQYPKVGAECNRRTAIQKNAKKVKKAVDNCADL